MRVLVQVGAYDAKEKIAALIDSGAEKSFLGQDVVTRLNQRSCLLQVKPTNTKVYAINGTNLPVQSCLAVTIYTELGNFTHEFLVADLGNEVVLGYDFLRRNRLEWSWEFKDLRQSGME